MVTYGTYTITSYNSIVSTEVYYYQSSSPINLEDGSWSITKPTWVNGKYIWQKIKTIYEDGTASESQPVNITGQQGNNGYSATSYKLSANHSMIVKDEEGHYSISSIIFSSYSKTGIESFSSYSGRYIIEITTDNTNWTTVYSSNSDQSTTTYTLANNLKEIRCSLYQSGGLTILLDRMTIPVISNGISISSIQKYYINAITQPPKPNDTTISAWSTTEPTYTPTFVGNVYTVEKINYSDGSSYYSDVSLSASFIASREAYNLASLANNKASATYGTCSTGADVNSKEVTCANFVLFKGARLQMRFQNANTALNPTLNVNNTGAKNIYLNDSIINNTNRLIWIANSKIDFVYDDVGWVIQNVPSGLFGTCNTVGGTSAKQVTCGEAVVCKGSSLSVQMTYGNTAADASLNLNSTIPIDIYANDAKLTTNSRYNWNSNTIQNFIFDGQYWRMTDDTSKTSATAYISTINNDGIMVHPANDTTTGWSIANAVELFKSGISYIKLWIDNNIPKIRIGREDQGHLILDNDSVNVMENTNNNLASFGKKTTIGGENSSRFVLSPNEITGQYKDGNESFHIYNYYTTKTGEKDIIENQKISPYSQSNNGNTFQYILQNAPIIDPQGTINIIVIGYNNNKEEIASASQTLEYKYFYDSSNNPIRLTVNGEVFEEWTYDENGNLIGVDEYHSAIEGISYDISGDRPKTGDIFEIRYEPFSGRYVVVTTSSNITSINLQVSYITLAEIQIPNPYYTFGSRLGVSQGSYSFTVGKNNTASAECSVALGAYCKANANYSYAEGKDTTASGYYSHAEGYETASGSAYTHAEGCRTIASSPGSHAEGQETTASGSWSHAEGYATTASGSWSHAEGHTTTASGNHSHAQNYGTQALSYAQTTMGKWNIADNTEKYALIIGNGSNNSRSNALTVAWDGNVELALDTAASSGTVDADLYDAITALGWENDVLVV